MVTIKDMARKVLLVIYGEIRYFQERNSKNEGSSD